MNKIWLKIPGSWVSAGQYVDISILTRHSRTSLRQSEVPKLCPSDGGKVGMALTNV